MDICRKLSQEIMPLVVEHITNQKGVILSIAPEVVHEDSIELSEAIFNGSIEESLRGDTMDERLLLIEFFKLVESGDICIHIENPLSDTKYNYLVKLVEKYMKED